MSEWIASNERIPKPHVSVLVYIASGYYEVKYIAFVENVVDHSFKPYWYPGGSQVKNSYWKTLPPIDEESNRPREL